MAVETARPQKGPQQKHRDIGGWAGCWVTGAHLVRSAKERGTAKHPSL